MSDVAPMLAKVNKLILCRDCGLKKPSAFAKHKTRGYQNQCKICRAEYNRTHYKENAAAYKRSAKRSRKQRKRALKEKLIALMSCLVCEACGEADPVVLDFHHRNPKTKKFTISTAI